jgi:hypothetical protein
VDPGDGAARQHPDRSGCTSRAVTGQADIEDGGIVAEFRYQQMLLEGQRQQVVVGARAPSAGTRSMSTSLRQQRGVLIVRIGLRGRGVQATARESLAPTSNGEVGAVA